MHEGCGFVRNTCSNFVQFQRICSKKWTFTHPHVVSKVLPSVEHKRKCFEKYSGHFAMQLQWFGTGAFNFKKTKIIKGDKRSTRFQKGLKFGHFKYERTTSFSVVACAWFKKAFNFNFSLLKLDLVISFPQACLLNLMDVHMKIAESVLSLLSKSYIQFIETRHTCLLKYLINSSLAKKKCS